MRTFDFPFVLLGFKIQNRFASSRNIHKYTNKRMNFEKLYTPRVQIEISIIHKNWMKNQQNTKNLSLLLQIAFSGWLTGHYNFRCQPVDYSNNPRTLRVCVKKKKYFANVESRLLISHIIDYEYC